MVEIELEFTVKFDGDTTSYEYKIEDGGCDMDMITLIQEARMRLTHKIKNLIDSKLNSS